MPVRQGTQLDSDLVARDRVPLDHTIQKVGQGIQGWVLFKAGNKAKSCWIESEPDTEQLCIFRNPPGPLQAQSLMTTIPLLSSSFTIKDGKKNSFKLIVKIKVRLLGLGSSNLPAGKSQTILPTV